MWGLDSIARSVAQRGAPEQEREPDVSDAGPAHVLTARRALVFLTGITVIVATLLGAVLCAPATQASAPPVVASPIVQTAPPGKPTISFYPQLGGLSSKPPAADRRGASYVAYSPDGFALAVGTPFGINIYSALNSEAVRLLGFIDTGTPVTGLAYSPDGSLLASGSFTDTVQLWNAQSGTLARSLTTPQGAVNGLAFGLNGAALATASADGAVRLWRVADGQLLWAAKGHLGPALAVAFAPDGSLVGSGGVDGAVRLWQVSNGSPVSALVGNLGGVPSVAFAPGGWRIAAGAGDGAVRLWEFRTGQLPQAWSGHSAAVTALRFAPDGSALASGSYDGKVLAWQVRDGQLLSTLQGATGPIISVAFAPDGDSLAVGAVDGAVQLWPVWPETGPSLTLASPGNIVVVPTTPAAPTQTPVPPCADAAAFVADVTVPDNSVVAPGTPMNKTWRVRNSGACLWGPGYQLQFLSGDRLGAASPQAVGETPPGASADITVPLVAPNSPGIYQGVWQLAGAGGRVFGPRLTITVVVLPPAAPTAQPLPTAGLPPPSPAPQPPAPSEPMVDISASATEIDAGSRVTIRVSVANIQAAWLDGEAVVNNYGETTVELCDDRTFTAEALLGDGQRLRKSVTVRVRGQCEEAPITFTEPDLVVAALSASPSTVEVGRSVKFSLTIKNQGDAATDDFQLALMLGDIPVATLADGIRLRAGEQKTIEKSVTFGPLVRAGSHKFTAWVDSTAAVFESREDNNKKSVTVKVVLPRLHL